MLYKTIWIISNETMATKTKFTYYHFGKNPQLPSWYCEPNCVYTIEMAFNLQLVINLKTFFKCLTHSYEGKDF